MVSALFGADEEVGEDRVRGSALARKDFLTEEATPEALAGAFCVWRSRAPSEEAKAPRLDLEAAGELLDRLLLERSSPGGSTARDGACLTLALLLARKRRLTIVSEREGALVVRRPKEERTFEVPAPTLTEAEEVELEQELARLFE
jgi:hypothetical protein